MPRLSDTMEEGAIVSWLVRDGQVVAQGEEIAEIETDKSTVPYEAPEAGVLRILVPPGSRLRVGQPIGLIDDLTPLPGSAPAQPSPDRSPAWGPAPQQPTGWQAPPHVEPEEDEGETTEFAAVQLETPELFAEPADDDYDLPTQEHAAAAAPPPAPEPPTAPVVPPAPVAPEPPVSPEPPTPPAPVADAAPANPWGDASGTPSILVPSEAPQPPAGAAPPAPRFSPEDLIAPPIAPPQPPEQRPAPAGGPVRVQASPVARRLAEELGLDLSQIQGTGPEGRVVRADIEAAQAQGLARPPMPAGAVPSAQSEFTPPPADAPQPPIPPVEPTPEPEPDVPAEPAQPEAPAPTPAPEIPAPTPAPEVPQEPAAPEPEPEPEVPIEPAPEPQEPAAPEPEPEVPQVPAEPEPAAEPEVPQVPEPELPTEPEPEPTPEPEEPEVPEAHAEPEATSPEPVREQVILPAAQPGGGKGEPTVIELSRQGQTIARRMAESKATIPHYAVRAEVDATPILGLRTDLAATRPDLAPPSVNDLVVRAAALALRAHPALNGAYRDGRVERYPRINIGIPVDIEDGLPVPVVLDADRLSLGQIAERTAELIAKARAGELRPADVASATFTVANLGMYGVDEFTAVITPGQAGVLTVGQIAQRPVVRDGELVTGQTLRLTLLVDHRAIYGGPAARFLTRVRQLLEHPTSLLA